MKYKFKYRWRFFWRTILVIGHNLDKDLDRMDLYLEGGGILSLSRWSRFDLLLGSDWQLAVKTKMEEESNQTIKVRHG